MYLYYIRFIRRHSALEITARRETYKNSGPILDRCWSSKFQNSMNKFKCQVGLVNHEDVIIIMIYFFSKCRNVVTYSIRRPCTTWCCCSPRCWRRWACGCRVLRRRSKCSWSPSRNWTRPSADDTPSAAVRVHGAGDRHNHQHQPT